jgi:hypothetical protein
MNWGEQLEHWRNTEELPVPIFDALLKLTPRICRTYDARLYSPLRMWDDDAYRSLAVDTMAILKAGYVKRSQHVGRCDREIRAYMATIVRSLMEQTAARHGPRRYALQQKLRRILRRDRCFQKFAAGWGFRSGAVSEGASGLPSSEAGAHRARTSGYHPSEGELKVFILELLSTIDCPVSFYTLVWATQVHFGVVDAIECPWPVRCDPDTGEERPMEFEDPRANVSEMEVRVKDAVHKFLKRLIQSKAPRSAGGISRRAKTS